MPTYLDGYADPVRLPRRQLVITIPVWLFATLCGGADLLAPLLVRTLLVADRRVDRILVEELAAAALPPVGSDRTRECPPPAASAARVAVTDLAPRRGRP